MRTRIKFCGLVRPDDIDTAVALGVDAIGFVFYPKSPRYLDAVTAASLRRRLPSWVTAVGLVVNESVDTVQQLRSTVGLDVVQFHGDETLTLCDQAAGALPWWRAVRMRGPGDLLESARNFPGAEALLVDSFHAGYGGSGQVFDWSWIPADRPVPLVLSGGLDPDRVTVAIEHVAPFAVDVSSGIQGSNPRIKDPALMERFVAAVLDADSRRCSQTYLKLKADETLRPS
ncbi:MAG: phosphoribosylanthranilate isomerase [Betaproteobacteria bacterium]